MWTFLLEIWVDIKLWRDDKKHHKKISKLEIADKKSYWFKKHILTPSNLVQIRAISIVTIAVLICLSVNYFILKPRQTKNKIQEISNFLNKWKTKYGNLPNSLKAISINRPHRQSWLNDSWGNPYIYEVNKNDFLITSLGKDGKLNTKDDITNNNLD